MWGESSERLDGWAGDPREGPARPLDARTLAAEYLPEPVWRG